MICDILNLIFILCCYKNFIFFLLFYYLYNFQILSTALFMSIIYFLTGQPFELFRFSMMFLMLIITGLMSQASGMLVAILFKNFLVSIFLYFKLKLIIVIKKNVYAIDKYYCYILNHTANDIVCGYNVTNK